MYEVTSIWPNPVEWLLLLWLSGNLVSEVQICIFSSTQKIADETSFAADDIWLRLRPRHCEGKKADSRRFAHMIDQLQVLILILAALAIAIHILAFLLPALYYSDLSNDEKLHFAHTMLYLKNQLLAFGLLFAFVEYLDFLTVHHLFGVSRSLFMSVAVKNRRLQPWAIIIRDLMYDLTRFLVILMLFVCGFTLHVTSIFQVGQAMGCMTRGACFAARLSAGRRRQRRADEAFVARPDARDAFFLAIWPRRTGQHAAFAPRSQLC